MGMLRERVSPEQVVAATASIEPRKALGQKCEAYFYVGQVYLMRGDAQRAKAAFESAVATGSVEHLEYDWALRELELMEPRP
jgi:lipoprotein NlpI